MSGQGWRTTVRTGNPQADLQLVEQHRAHAAAQGLTVQVVPLAQGGYEVQALAPAVAAAPPPAGPSAVGSTLPSNVPQVGARPAAGPSAAPVAPSPAPAQPGGDPSGTMPSRFAPVAGMGAAPAPQVRYEGPLVAPTPPAGVTTLRRRRARGLAFVVLGVVLCAGAAPLAVVGATWTQGADTLAGVETLLFSVLCGVPGVLLFVLGLRGRLRATAALRRMGLV